MDDDIGSKKTEIALNGSVDIVSDFFFTAINSILYQRGELCRRQRRACYVSLSLLDPLSSTLISL